MCQRDERYGVKRSVSTQKKKIEYFIHVQFLKRICDISFIYMRHKEKYICANGIAVCTWKHNKSNANGNVPRHAEPDKEIFANGALLSFPVMRHEYNRRERTHWTSPVVFSLGILYRTFEITRSRDRTLRRRFYYTQIFPFIYTPYRRVESLCFVRSYFTEKSYTRARTRRHEASSLLSVGHIFFLTHLRDNSSWQKYWNSDNL